MNFFRSLRRRVIFAFKSRKSSRVKNDGVIITDRYEFQPSSVPTADAGADKGLIPAPALLYEPLDEACSEIRLLEILPSSNKTAIVKCRLFKALLKDKPAYFALSYVWGDPGVTENIIFNSKVARITTNLASALQHIRSRILPLFKRTRILWADAVCINQKDTAERSRQVQLMREIYQGAIVVLSWLGPGDEEISLSMSAFRLIRRESMSSDYKNLNWKVESLQF
jgi:hypothetical protein